MSVTDYKFPGTCANADRDSKAAWTNPGNASADDATGATNVTGKSTYSDWLRVTNFGFSTSDIPSGSIIDGIEVMIEHFAAGDTYEKDSAIYLRKTSGQVGSNYASATTWTFNAWQVFTYGGSSDKWGTTWSDTDITSSDFGLDFSLYSGPNTASHGVDYIKIRVYYHEGTPDIKCFTGVTA